MPGVGTGACWAVGLSCLALEKDAASLPSTVHGHYSVLFPSIGTKVWVTATVYVPIQNTFLENSDGNQDLAGGYHLCSA